MLRFVDSFDHLAMGDMTEKWTSTAGANMTIAAGQGRRGTAAFNIGIISATAYLTLTLDAQPTWIVGFSYRFTTLHTSSTVIPLSLKDGATTQVDLRLTTAGLLQVTRNGTVLGTSVVALSAGVTRYLELLATIHGSAGVVTVRVDGVAVLALTGQNTQVTASASANVLWLGNPGGASTGHTYFDDVYVCDGTGAAPHNTLLGDCRVDVLLPTADGANSAWTPSTGTTHSTLVDEAVPNDDTDYLSTLTVAARDTHHFADLPALTNPIILGVQHCINARKDDAGTRQLKSVIKSGATTQAGPTTLTLAAAYAYYREIWPVDPATGVAWTVAGVNAVEAGFDNLV